MAQRGDVAPLLICLTYRRFPTDCAPPAGAAVNKTYFQHQTHLPRCPPKQRSALTIGALLVDSRMDSSACYISAAYDNWLLVLSANRMEC